MSLKLRQRKDLLCAQKTVFVHTSPKHTYVFADCILSRGRLCSKFVAGSKSYDFAICDCSLYSCCDGSAKC